MSIGTYPIIDEASCGSLPNMMQAVEQLLKIVNSDTVVVPGHGAIGNRDSLLTFRDMLRTIEGRIQPLIASGKSFSDILAAALTADFDPAWGGGYVTGDLFVRMVVAGFGLTEQPTEELLLNVDKEHDMDAMRSVLTRLENEGAALGHFHVADLVLLKAVLAAAAEIRVPVLVC
jgi:hypothetical protein